MKTLLLGLEPDDFTTTQLDTIRATVPDMHTRITTDRDEMARHLETIEIALHQFPRDLMVQAPNLRWYQFWGAGADWVLQYPQLTESDVIITNGSGVHPIPITEHIFAFLFAFARGFPHAARRQVESRWKGLGHHGVFELAGKTMVLIGVGAIGKRTAMVANALDMKVIGVRRNPAVSMPHVAHMVGPDQLHAVLPAADFVVLTVPLTSETRHLFDEAALRAMKPSAYIVNIGRGQTIDQNALVRALQEGWIAGAGLDVTDPEPLPAESPLWSMENVLITAHYAGCSPHYHDRIYDIFLANLHRYRAGEDLQNVVDKRLGY